MEGAEDTTTTSEGSLISAAAFVEGGIQDACDDACSICLEVFCQSNPSTLTTCKHEYHLQCILEWCQRRSQCPMCWQSISLKDPTSQELLEAVEQERNLRFNPSRNATVFRHPALGEFELQLPAGVDNTDIEERIIQHLAAAAAMGRARHGARREGYRNRSSSQGHQQFMVFSLHPDASSPPPPPPIPSSPSRRDESDTVTNLPLSPHNALGEGSHQSNTQTATSSHPLPASPSASDSNRRSPNQSSPSDRDRAGTSFSESVKSRLNAVSTRYKESISKSTRNWKDRFFSRNTSMADLGSEVKREVSAGIATVSRMMERLDTRENSKPGTASVSNVSENQSPESSNEHTRSEGGDEHSVNERGVNGTCATGSGSS